MKNPYGSILYVDLDKRASHKKEIPTEWKEKYIGGRGINVRLLFDEAKPGIDALSPENPLIFGTGLLSGTKAPCPARFNITAKSPLTGIVGDTNAGGHFGPSLKRAGIDHIVFRGKASEPVYLFIDDDKVEIRSARNLWGKNIRETEKLIKEELGDKKIRVAAIPGAARGTTTLRKAPTLLQPSIIAASSNSTGTSSIKPRIIHTDKGRIQGI